MPISTVTLVNTFDQWRIRTNESITVLNNYLDDGVRDASYTYRNLTANVVTSNTVNSETISSNTIFANTILVSNATILNVNTVFLIANLVRSNSVNTTNLVVNQINANSILLTANNMNVDQAIRSSYIQANTGRDHANGAFLTANAAFAAQNVTSDVANASYDQANTARLHANGAFLTANSAFGAQNVTSAVANASFGVANAAFGAQNVTSAVANASFGVANAAFGAQNVTSAVANAAFGVANAAFGAQNVTSAVANAAFGVANASFGAQNVTSGVANASFGVANAAFGAQNVTSGVANASFGVANAAFGAQNVTSAVANAAFSRGNTAVLKTGNTMTGNLVFSGANIAFFASASDGSTLGRGFSNLGIYFSNTAGPGIESAIYANSANIIVFATKKTERVRIDDAGRLNVGTIDIVQFATAAFAVANAATTTGDGGLAAAISAYNAQNVTSGVANAAYDQANTARVHANGAFLTANAAFGAQNVTSAVANAAFGVANAAFGAQNVTSGVANASFGVANAAYNQANTARVHANGAFLTANAAFGQANVAGLQPGIIANAAFAQANSTSAATTIGSAAYDQANTARTHANAAFAQANTASTTAVAGFDAANTKVTKSGDTLTGDLTFTSASNQLLLKVTDGAIEITRSAGGAYIDFKDSSAEDVDVRLTYSSTNLQKVLSGGATSTIWDSGNDGAGSGLDADLLDGQQGSYYAPLSSPTFTGTVTIPTLSVTTGATIVSPTITGTSNTAGATVLSQTLTDGVTVTWDIPKGQIATLTLGGNRTMAAPTNLKVGTFVLHVIQDGTGGRTITWNSVFKWTQGVAPTLSTAIGARDVFSFVCDGTNLYGAMIPDVR